MHHFCMGPKKDRKPKAYSFSLAELIFVSGFVGIGLTSVISILSVGLDVGNQAIEKSIATIAADQFLQYNITDLKTSPDWGLLEAFPDSKPDLDDLDFMSDPDYGWSNTTRFENQYIRIRFLTHDSNDPFSPSEHSSGYFLLEQLEIDGSVGFRQSLRAWKEFEQNPTTGWERVILYAEISYPPEKPYLQRTRTTFSKEVVKKPDIPLDP